MKKAKKERSLYGTLGTAFVKTALLTIYNLDELFSSA